MILKMANNARHAFSPEKAAEQRIFRVSIGQFSKDYKVECQVNGRKRCAWCGAQF
jgi:hypothetical protein